MPPRIDRIERIRKLLALAQDQAGTPEGEAAARMARRLMLRQSVALSELDPSERARRDPVVRRTLDLGGREHWRRRLAGEVARHCECLLTWSRGDGQVYIYGHRSGVDIAEYLLVLLTRQVAAAREDHVRPELDLEERARDLRSFTESIVLALANRLRALRAAEGEGTALVRARGKELDEWLADHGYRFKNYPPSPFGYNQEGYETGCSIPMHDGVRAEPVGVLPR